MDVDVAVAMVVDVEDVAAPEVAMTVTRRLLSRELKPSLFSTTY